MPTPPAGMIVRACRQIHSPSGGRSTYSVRSGLMNACRSHDSDRADAVAEIARGCQPLKRRWLLAPDDRDSHPEPRGRRAASEHPSHEPDLDRIRSEHRPVGRGEALAAGPVLAAVLGPGGQRDRVVRSGPCHVGDPNLERPGSHHLGAVAACITPSSSCTRRPGRTTSARRQAPRAAPGAGARRSPERSRARRRPAAARTPHQQRGRCPAVLGVRIPRAARELGRHETTVTGGGIRPRRHGGQTTAQLHSGPMSDDGHTSPATRRPSRSRPALPRCSRAA